MWGDIFKYVSSSRFSSLNAPKMSPKLCCSFFLAPSTLPENFIEVKSDTFLLNQALNLSFDVIGKNSHECLGRESILGPFLVVSLGHVAKHSVGCLVDIVDNSTEVCFEVSVGKILKICESVSGNVSFPLKLTFAIFNNASKRRVIFHELSERFANLELIRWG